MQSLVYMCFCFTCCEILYIRSVTSLSLWFLSSPASILITSAFDTLIGFKSNNCALFERTGSLEPEKSINSNLQKLPGLIGITFHFPDKIGNLKTVLIQSVLHLFILGGFLFLHSFFNLPVSYIKKICCCVMYVLSASGLAAQSESKYISLYKYRCPQKVQKVQYRYSSVSLFVFFFFLFNAREDLLYIGRLVFTQMSIGYV